MDRRTHGGGVDDRQNRLDVLFEEAVEEGEVVLAQGRREGETLQGISQLLELGPHPLNLLLQGFHLVGQQGFEAQGQALAAAEGGAFVEAWMSEKFDAPQGRSDGAGELGRGAQKTQAPG